MLFHQDVVEKKKKWKRVIELSKVQLNKEQRISLSGSNAIIQKEKPIIESLNLTGNEAMDRLIIQKCIDDNNLKSKVLYEGNTVYPLKKIVKEYRQLQKTGTLDKLTNDMYHFFTNACGDIAHYNIDGFRSYYCNSLQNLENTILNKPFYCNTRFADFDAVCKKLKIGRYFEERNNVDINIVPLKRIKEFFVDTGFEVKEENNCWEISSSNKKIYAQPVGNSRMLEIRQNKTGIDEYAFTISLKEKNASEVINEIQKYYKNFDKDNFVLQLYEKNKDGEDSSTISDLVHRTEYFLQTLSKLINKIAYMCKNEAEILLDNIKTQDRSLNVELEYER